MKLGPTHHGGRHLFADCEWGMVDIHLDRAADGREVEIVDADRAVVGHGRIVFRERIDTDLETERRALKQGGCCGQPTE